MTYVLKEKIANYKKKRRAFFQKNRRVQERLRKMEAEEATGGSGLQELRKQNDALKELFKVETTRDECRAKVEHQDCELQDLWMRTDELQRKAEEAQRIKNEIAILHRTADLVGQYEATIASYKKKLDEASDMKRQLKLLEDKNLELVQQNLQLEYDVKKSGTWRPQLELYKEQVAELHSQLAEETKRADRVAFESRQAAEKLTAAQGEKVILIFERDALKEKLKCLQMQAEVKLSSLEEISKRKDVEYQKLKDQLKRTDQEKQAIEEKYKRCMEKAKTLINSLPKKVPPMDVNFLCSQLSEKDRVIQELQRNKEKYKQEREMEDRLMSTALHTLGLNRHREAVDQHLAALNSGQGQSFLFLAHQQHPNRQRCSTPHKFHFK